MNVRQKTIAALAALLAAVGAVAAAQQKAPSPRTIKHPAPAVNNVAPTQQKVVKSKAEWKRLLSPAQYHVTREAGTERAFTGVYNDFKGKGTFLCVGCGNPLFSSNTKFESGTGWPSFWAPLGKTSVREQTDQDGGRTEVLCRRGDGHLGHVFDDGPKPTGLRYCMNSVALAFRAAEKQKPRK